MEKDRLPLLRARKGSALRPPPRVAGVASGIAAHVGISVKLVRTALVLSTFLGGTGAIFYAWLWATVPLEGTARAQLEKESPEEIPQNPFASPLKPATPRASRPRSQLLILGIGALILGLLLWLIPLASTIPWQEVAFLLIVAAGIAVMWMQVPRLFEANNKLAIAMAFLGAGLVIFGTIPVVSKYIEPHRPADHALVGIVVTAVLLTSLVPIGVRALGEVTSTQTQMARESERAEIAAHLHDSVLQTLTLIRSAADEPADVRALALRQERELRAWLYTGKVEASQSVAEALREEASGVESSYGIPIESVTVGDREPSTADQAAIAAAAEAMKNAARHGKPPISVYQEATPDRLEIFVKDSGTGFDPNDIPDDRHGYRDSIVGRVERVGGTVELRFRAGTEVQIVVPRGKENE